MSQPKILKANLKMPEIKPNRVLLLTLGCSKNRVDSEHLLRQMASSGIELAPENEDLADGRIDTVIINTCGFIKDAKQESIDAILAAVDAKNRGYIRNLVVFGCLSQRCREELIQEIPEVDAFFGALDNTSMLEAMGVIRKKELEQERVLTTPSHYAYLKISEGCDRVCSYCAIPLIRGPHRSVPMEDLIREASNLADSGVKELIVIAQDTTYYGLDLYGKRMLGELLRRLAEIEGIEWIRLHYSYPAAFPEDVLDIMAGNPKICRYLDIPLQHISDKVLSAMRRSIDGESTRRLVRKIREKVPGIVLRTTMIVGHPGEDSREFEKLLRFVSEASFERLGAFTYSEEEGTYGAENLKDTVRESTKSARYERLMELQSEISLRFNMSRIGREETVIIDSYSGDGVYSARSMYESPEVDGEVLVGTEDMPDDSPVREAFASDPESLVGTFAKVRIVGADEYDLIARFV